MKIHVSSVYVDSQDKALRFYTEILGFQKKSILSLGKNKWITLVSPEDPDGTELLLEPSDNPAARTFQKTLYRQGIPATSFAVEDIQAECGSLRSKGVKIVTEPADRGSLIAAVIDDTCGNLIQLVQRLPA